jgi:sigma-E factor negative regulatory protein RseB
LAGIDRLFERLLESNGLLRRVTLILILCLPQASHALPDENPPKTGIDWLLAMKQAANTLDYQGVVAYIKDQQVDSFKLYHKVDGVHVRERLIAMNSPFREVIRTDGSISRYTGEGQQIMVETRPSSQSVYLSLPDDPSVLGRYYRINLMGQEYVAGMLAQVVALEPRDGFRYSRLLWIDAQSKLPLKLDVLDESGHSIEQMVFTTISVSEAVKESDLLPSHVTQAAIARISHNESLPLDRLGWTLNKVPEGFQIVSYSRFKRPTSDQVAEHVLLSDGFATISVYIDQGASSLAAGSRKIGAVNVKTSSSDGYTITVMGEVPPNTVNLIADGLRKKSSVAHP